MKLKLKGKYLLRKISRIVAVALTFTMLFSLTACGSSDNDGEKTEKTKITDTTESPTITETSSTDALKGIYDIFLKNSSYATIKSTNTNTTFEEELEGERIVVKVSGTDGLEGTYVFPAQDGYLNCKVTAGDYMAVSLFSIIISSVGEYYGFNSTVFQGYLNGLDVNGIESNLYFADNNEDGSGTMKIYYAEKPEMKELDEMYINEKALQGFSDERMQSFSTIVGKMIVNGSIAQKDKTISFAVGEYGDTNTELTYKSIVDIVKFFKPNGYEDFLKDYTELTTVSKNNYKVHTNFAEYSQENIGQLPDGYTFMFVTFN